MKKDSIHDFLGTFNDQKDIKITKALDFYNNYVDKVITQQKLDDYPDFDWDLCRAICFVGKSYSHSRFMKVVAEYFKISVDEIKNRMKKI